MKKKSEKKKDIDALHQDLEQSGNLFVTGYEKLRVDQDFELRKAVRGAGGKYRVIKNNLAEIAAQGTPSEAVLKNLRGMTSLAYTSNDPVGAGEGADHLCEGEPLVHLQGGDCGRPGDRRGGHHRAGQHAVEGTDLFEAVVPDQRSGPAVGDGDAGGGSQPGRW